MNAVDLLTQEHREVEDAFERYEQLDEGDVDRKKMIAREVIEALVQHAAMEERAFYPTVQEVLPDMIDEIEDDLQEHQEAEELLADLDGMNPSEAEFDEIFGKLIADVNHHVEDEEGELFPRVREAFTDQELDDLGEAMMEIRKTAPTRPHPNAPQEPSAKAIADSGAALLDQVRDSVRARQDRNEV